MNETTLTRLVTGYYSGRISEDDHRQLEHHLKSSPEARALFRELVDLEVGLATLAAETASTDSTAISGNISIPAEGRNRPRRRLLIALTGLAALIVCSLMIWQLWLNGSGNGSRNINANSPETAAFGTIRQTDCSWTSYPYEQNSDRFSRGSLELESGIAELKFESGARLVLEGPCSLEIESINEARLNSGNLVVNVSGLSDGFRLRTPEASFFNNATEYAIALSEKTTEVHVFDGEILWQPESSPQLESETIVAGEAVEFSRIEHGAGRRIPFGQRQFIRQMEQQVRDDAAGELIAFDGFENLAGRIRQGRSGFGFQGGWTPPGRRRANATVVDAPDGTLFGIERIDQRELNMAAGTATRREFQEPLFNDLRKEVFISLILKRNTPPVEENSFFQVSLTSSDSGTRRGRRRENPLAFGLTSSSFPFAKSGGAINETGIRIPGDALLLVARISIEDPDSARVDLRVFNPSEDIPEIESGTWAVSSTTSKPGLSPTMIEFSCGENGDWNVDHLRIGESWGSVIRSR